MVAFLALAMALFNVGMAAMITVGCTPYAFLGIGSQNTCDSNGNIYELSSSSGSSSSDPNYLGYKLDKGYWIKDILFLSAGEVDYQATLNGGSIVLGYSQNDMSVNTIVASSLDYTAINGRYPVNSGLGMGADSAFFVLPTTDGSAMQYTTLRPYPFDREPVVNVFTGSHNGNYQLLTDSSQWIDIQSPHWDDLTTLSTLYGTDPYVFLQLQGTRMIRYVSIVGGTGTDSNGNSLGRSNLIWVLRSGVDYNVSGSTLSFTSSTSFGS